MRGHRRGDRRPALVRRRRCGWSSSPARNRLPFTWHDTDRAEERDAAALVAGLDAASLPLVRLPGGAELRGPSTGQVSRALGIGLELAPREEVDLLVVGGGPAGLGAAVYGASEGLETLVVESTALGGQAGSSRRIENYLGFPAGITGTELTSRAVTQARKFDARTATPYRALSLEPGNGRHVVRLEEDREIAARAVLLATGAQYRRLPVERLSRVRGDERLLRGRTARGAALRRLARRRGRRRQLGRPGRRLARARRRARDAAPSPRRPARDDVGLPRPRARALRRRRARPQRDRRPARRRRPARGGHAEDGERLPFSFLFLFLGALPCTEWLGDAVARDEKGFILTGAAAGAEQPARDEPARASSRPATSARARPSAAPPPSARARWPCSSSTPGSRSSGRAVTQPPLRPGAGSDRGCEARAATSASTSWRRRAAASAPGRAGRGSRWRRR